MGQCQPRALFPIDEVVDDVLDTDEGARDEAKEANKEESSIFGSPNSENQRSGYQNIPLIGCCE